MLDMVCLHKMQKVVVAGADATRTHDNAELKGCTGFVLRTTPILMKPATGSAAGVVLTPKLCKTW